MIIQYPMQYVYLLFILRLQQAAHCLQYCHDLWFEAHVNHAIRLVQNHVVTLVQHKVVVLYTVHHSPWGAYDDLHALPETEALVFN